MNDASNARVAAGYFGTVIVLEVAGSVWQPARWLAACLIVGPLAICLAGAAVCLALGAVYAAGALWVGARAAVYRVRTRRMLAQMDKVAAEAARRHLNGQSGCDGHR